MVTAIAAMYLYLWATREMNLREAGYSCARAFVLAELAASLEWQLHCWLWPQRGGGEIPALLLLAAVYGAAKVLTNGGLHMPPPGIGQRAAEGRRGLAAAGQEKGRLSGAADRCRVTAAAVSADQLPVLPGAVQRSRQKLHAGYSRLHRIGQSCRIKGTAER